MGPILKPTYKGARVREPVEQRWPWVIVPIFALLAPASAFSLVLFLRTIGRNTAECMFSHPLDLMPHVIF